MLSSESIQLDTLTICELGLDDRARWDQFNQSLPTSCFMQSWAWADFKQIEGYQTFRYGIFQQETLVGGGIFYFYPRPHSANLLIAPGIPCFTPGYEVIGMELLLEQVKQLLPTLSAIALRVEPLFLQKPPFLEKFVRAPVDLLPSETLLIDLCPDEAEILANMKPKGRYNIRLSQRYGVETEFTTELQNIPRFYDLFWETVERQQFFGEPYGFFINLCQTLFAANMAEIGLATWNDQLLAAILVIYWGDRATYLYGGRSSLYPHVMANYGLHWAAMQRAKSKGCQVYDFYGYTQNPRHNYAKFSQFKRQFGGKPVTTIGAHDYFFYDQLTDLLINTLRKLAQP
ncbi:lipid II:glycine glycyltransferase FemX [Pantanalinema sp. GBBB05]|uniref:lipid II:glycine glycyltransferase FemX n=1 Tax=Pantanalinema sp. GBBB05 TaxID=2604139 RepID=UPI003D819BB0